MSVDAAVSLVRVTKRFLATPAVDGVTVALRPGDVTCLGGPNGSGKTTLLALIAGLCMPTSGDVRVGGLGARTRKRVGPRPQIGYLPQRPVLYEHLTGLEHLRFVSQLHRDGRTSARSLGDLLGLFGLEEHAHSLIRHYSEGMKRKVAFLAAVAHDPEIVLLDEPLAGMDRAGTSRAVDILQEAEVRGACILVATHRPEAFSPIANRWLTLRRGRLVADRRVSPAARPSGRGLGATARVGPCEPEAASS